MLKKLSLGLLLALATVSLHAGDKNVVFFLVDDLGIQDMSIEGSTFYETPHIDKLAASGIRFTRGYSACQVCSPSRASIMLGTAPPRHGITDWIGAATGTRWNRNDRVLPSANGSKLPAEDVTLAEAMKEAGYTTGYFGKWHIGGEGSFPEDHGFDVNVGGHHRGSPPGGFFSPYRNPKMKDGPEGESLTLRLANETSSFIKQNKDQKFLAVLAFYAVHAPIQTTPELQKKYTEKATKAGLVEKRFVFDRTKPVRQVQDNPVYAGMMETLDDAVGIVMKTLTDQGIADDTVVIFTGDNGGVSSGDAHATACLPFRGGKGRQWEGGIRAPFYVFAPGVTKPKSLSSAPAIGMDFYPTILDLAGIPLKPKQHVDGISLLPALKGQEMPKRDLFWHYPHYGNQGGEPSAIIISGDKKLIHYFEDGRNELYDIKADIGEQTDILKQHPEAAAKMKQKLDAWLKDTGALIPKQDDRFDAAKKKVQLENMRTKGVAGQEARHAKYFK
jgi:arylsulfatase A-like enzyme